MLYAPSIDWPPESRPEPSSGLSVATSLSIASIKIPARDHHRASARHPVQPTLQSSGRALRRFWLGPFAAILLCFYDSVLTILKPKAERPRAHMYVIDSIPRRHK